MANFYYTAKTNDGETRTGLSEAGNIRELAQILKRQGLILVRADSEIDRDKKNISMPFLSRKVSLSEKMFMTRNTNIFSSSQCSSFFVQ